MNQKIKDVGNWLGVSLLMGAAIVLVVGGFFALVEFLFG